MVGTAVVLDSSTATRLTAARPLTLAAAARLYSTTALPMPTAAQTLLAPPRVLPLRRSPMSTPRLPPQSPSQPAPLPQLPLLLLLPSSWREERTRSLPLPGRPTLATKEWTVLQPHPMHLHLIHSPRKSLTRTAVIVHRGNSRGNGREGLVPLMTALRCLRWVPRPTMMLRSLLETNAVGPAAVRCPPLHQPRMPILQVVVARGLLRRHCARRTLLFFLSTTTNSNVNCSASEPAHAPAPTPPPLPLARSRSRPSASRSKRLTLTSTTGRAAPAPAPPPPRAPRLCRPPRPRR